jgi:hypothetical protein
MKWMNMILLFNSLNMIIFYKFFKQKNNKSKKAGKIFCSSN